MEKEERYVGSLLGLAVGDALGLAVEFKLPGTFTPLTKITGGGPFSLPAGAFTDDTSMALCLAESLVKTGGFDPLDQLERYRRWWREGHFSCTGACFDIGNTTLRALEWYERTGEPIPCDPQGRGNGSLMRLAPVPLYFARDPAEAVHISGESSKTTHGARECVDACRYFAALIMGALLGASKEELLKPLYEPFPGIWDKEPLHFEIEAVAKGSFLGKNPPEIRGTGYVATSLEAALWAFCSTGSFREGCLAAANLGEDADTTSAIFGQLAGAYYGASGIPESWQAKIFMGEKIEELALGLMAGPS
ncbi:ADP-ribosylglycohydrolase family protein [bacterium]|nr:MAG: ADP-ribosylglycohydrolase family protein [bacterium]